MPPVMGSRVAAGAHILGTDAVSRAILSRLIYGARYLAASSVSSS